MGPALIFLGWPLFRYSPTRDAFVLRLIGNSRGPVLVERARLETPPTATR